MSLVDFTAGDDSSQIGHGNQWGLAAVGAEDFPSSHITDAPQAVRAAGEHNPPAPAILPVAPMGLPPVLAPTPWADNNGPFLSLLADAVDDIESIRKASANRLRQLTRTEADSDGEERGFGFTLDVPQVGSVAAMLKAIKHDEKVLKDLGYDASAMGRPCACLECQAIRNLEKEMRKHPLGPWVKATVGVGEKQGARLVVAIGDPYWNTLYDRPRTVSELWAYCGLHVLPAAQMNSASHQHSGGGGKQGDPGQTAHAAHNETAGVAPTRARGQRANWSATAKMRAYLVADSCIKQARSPYRAVYDDGRAKYADALHRVDCRRCGPAGKPAPSGTPISAGHQHARAMRLVSKQILKDLWLESRRLHGIADEGVNQ